MKGFEDEIIGGTILDNDVPAYASLLVQDSPAGEEGQAQIEEHIMSIIPEKRGAAFLSLADSKGFTRDVLERRNEKWLAAAKNN